MFEGFRPLWNQVLVWANQPILFLADLPLWVWPVVGCLLPFGLLVGRRLSALGYRERVMFLAPARLAGRLLWYVLFTLLSAGVAITLEQIKDTQVLKTNPTN